jgi:hypothetical protein
MQEGWLLSFWELFVMYILLPSPSTEKNQLASSSTRFHASACPFASSIDSMERSSEKNLIVRDVRNWHEGWLHCLLERWIFRAFQKIERIGTQL